MKKDFNNQIYLYEIESKNLFYSLIHNENYDSIHCLMKNENKINLIKNSFNIAYRETYGSDQNFVVNVNFVKNGIIIEFYEKKQIVKDVYVDRSEIDYKEAKKIYNNCSIGDKIDVPFNKDLFSEKGILLASINIYEHIEIPNKNIVINSLRDKLSSLDNITEDSELWEHGASCYGNPSSILGCCEEDDYGDESWA
ncbi:MAG: NusA N-terminal domain-containing protein [Spirochaetales bacterium]|nr:NusA N-terminal domain-containing protein [Spirochaetales bacterium]